MGLLTQFEKNSGPLNSAIFCAKIATQSKITPKLGDAMPRFRANFSFTLALLSLLWFLTAFDGLLTAIHLSRGATEANPLLAYVLREWGLSAMLGVKFAVTIPCCLFLQYHLQCPQKMPGRQLATKGVHLLASIYGLVAGFHLWKI